MIAPKMSPDATTDHDLLRLMLAGDESSFVALYRRWQASLYRFALRMSGSAAIAEDVVQEVFIVLLREGARYAPEKGSVGSFLYGITRNHVLRRLERERNFVPIAEEDDESGAPPPPESLVALPDPVGDLARRETIQAVREAVLALPPHYREVVVLCELHEMNYADAAIVLGCPVGTVRSRLNRARALLSERLRSANEQDVATRSINPARCLI